MADITSISKSGTAAARVDITFVAEGYTAAERDKFLADAAKFADYMFREPNAAMNAPFSNYQAYFNVNALFVASNQSRWDVTSGTVDTYFKANSYLDDGRLVYGDTGKVYETVREAVPANAQDIIIVLVNSKAYGGAGGSISWATTGNISSAEVLLHELGHSVANLADEYIDTALGSTPVTGPLDIANVTIDKDSPPWKAWLGYEDALGKVGVFEGGLYRATGVWRATENSKMLSLGEPFNAPQKEALALAFYERIGDYLSFATHIPGMAFADVPDRNSLTFTWSQNGAVIPNSASYLFDIYASGKAVAGSSLTLSTIDSTGLIRTGLSKTQQLETLTIDAGPTDIAAAQHDVAQAGLLRFGAADNTINVHDKVNAYVDGGIGADTVVLQTTQTGFSLEQLATGTWLLMQGATAVLALRNVETIRFNDRTHLLVETQTGLEGDDRLLNRAASELIDGGAGTDWLAYSGARTGFSVEKSGSGFTITDLASGHADVLANVERLSFGDATMALDVGGVGGQAYRLYQAAFNRAPDSAGLGYWIGAMDRGMTVREVATDFAASAEFQGLFGANPSNALVVDKLYQNILHRAGDAGGIAFWLSVLDNKLDTLGGVLAAFSQSAENQSAVATVIGNGFAYTPFG